MSAIDKVALRLLASAFVIGLVTASVLGGGAAAGAYVGGWFAVATGIALLWHGEVRGWW